MMLYDQAPVRRLQWYAFLATGPFLWMALNYILFREAALQQAKPWLLSVFTIGLPGLLCWYLYGRLSWELKRTYPEARQTSLRVSLQLLALLVLVVIFTLLLFLLYSRAGFFGYRWAWSDVKLGLIVTLGLCLLVETLYEADYNRLRYQQSREEIRRLEQVARQQEFDSLRDAVNPHFLFNCFNTLSSLIGEDPVRANRFLGELSKVYRYLLLTNRESLSTVAAEVHFIRSYYQLLATRYGPALRLRIEIDPDYARWLIPSLSLQLLVENAVKHNVVQAAQPLTIDLFTVESDQLIVTNNLQRKLLTGGSTGMGLENIRQKYQLMEQPGFQIIEDEQQFTVALPLLREGGAASRHAKPFS